MYTIYMLMYGCTIKSYCLSYSEYNMFQQRMLQMPSNLFKAGDLCVLMYNYILFFVDNRCAQ